MNFCANNYLGLSDNTRLIDAAVKMMKERGYGMSSVRFICGTQDIHKELEAAIADYFKTDDAILYGSCFDANGGLFGALLDEHDAIISDANLTRRQIVSQAREVALAESERIVTKARQDIEHEKETALRELRGKVADLSMQIAGKVLRKSLDGDGEQLRYIDRLIDELSEQDK